MEAQAVRKSWIAWILVSLFSVAQFFLQISGNMIATPLMQTFHLDAAQLGVMNAAFFVGYVLVQIPGGLLYDRYQVRKVCLTAVSLCFIGCIGFALAHSYWVALVSRLVIGIGSGFAFIGMVYISAQWFPTKHFALLVGLGELLAMGGTALGQKVAPLLVLSQGWRALIWVMAALMAGLAMLILYYLQDQPRQYSRQTPAHPIRQLWHNLLETMSYRAVWVSGLYCLSMFGMVTGFIALWGIPFIKHVQGLSFLDASSLMAYSLLGIAVGGPVVGWINGYLEHPKRLMLVGNALTFITMMFVTTCHPLPFTLLAVLLFFAGFFASAYVLGFAITNLSLPTEIKGAGIGLCNTLALLGAVIFQPVSGMIIDYFTEHHMNHALGYELGVMLLPLSMLIAFIALAFLPESKEHIIFDEQKVNAFFSQESN